MGYNRLEAIGRGFQEAGDFAKTIALVPGGVMLEAVVEKSFLDNAVSSDLEENRERRSTRL